GVELRQRDRRRMPRLAAADRSTRGVDDPDRPVVEAQCRPERLQDARGRLRERSRLGERASGLVLDVEATDRIGLLGSAHGSGVALARASRDVTPRLGGAYDPRALVTRINRMNARSPAFAVALAVASGASAQEAVDLAVVHRIKARFNGR